MWALEIMLARHEFYSKVCCKLAGFVSASLECVRKNKPSLAKGSLNSWRANMGAFLLPMQACLLRVWACSSLGVKPRQGPRVWNNVSPAAALRPPGLFAGVGVGRSGCPGSPGCACLSLDAGQGAALHCGVRASPWAGFFARRAQALGRRVCSGCGLSSCGPRAPELGLSSGGARTWLLCGMWNLPGSGIKPASPALAGGFSSSAPPRKSYPTASCHFLVLP